ncbi:unnamed protein product [Candidula unifasciata]|uniref:Small ribosomal subunit protein bS6m n=1 Tax=Candidula unifasciata TaxID=100452 RepID=A0A8S3ZX06_9EUPU|nr:unnamed protein product [Candidula unifasciata]
MPTYELAVIFKSLQRPEFAQAIKRSCSYVMEQGGLIRGMENLGLKPLPYKLRNHGQRFNEGNYILIRFDGKTDIPAQLEGSFKYDTDVIKKRVFLEEKWVPPCTTGPCEFGELKNPDHEKGIWWARVRRRFVRSERRKAQKKA